MKLYDLVGWVGVGVILLAYLMLTGGLILADNVGYIAMNILGAASIIISSYPKKDLQAVALNLAWLLIAIFGLIRAISN